MFEKIEPLEFSKHQDLRLSTPSTMEFARQMSMVKLSFSELRHASRFCPIIFLKDGLCVPQALLSLEEGKNAFINEAGQWTAPYIPAFLRFYPFTLAKVEAKEGQEEEFALCLDPGAEHFKSGMGEPLFTAGGQPTDFIKDTILNALTAFQKELATTEKLFAVLDEKELIVDTSFKFMAGQEEKAIDGFKGVDMEKLMAMDDAFLAGTVKNGTIGMVHEHTHSQANFSNFISQAVPSSL